MIEFRKFKFADLAALEIPEALAYLDPIAADPATRKMFEDAGPAWSGFVDGKCVCSAGIAWVPGGGVAWAFMHSVPRAEWLAITRKVRAVLDEARAEGCRRVEAGVRLDFPQGQRWARMLGFDQVEGLTSRTPDGAEHIVYERAA